MISAGGGAPRGEPKPTPRVGVVVVTWNSAARLAACLDALAAQQADAPHTLVVVDNASSDGTPQLVADRYPDATLLRSPTNLGFAGGADRGLAHLLDAGADVAVLLNDDAVPQPGWLAALTRAIAQPRVGAVASKVVLAGTYLDLDLTFSLGGQRRLVEVSSVALDGADVTPAARWEQPEPGHVRLLVPAERSGEIALALRTPGAGAVTVRSPAGGGSGELAGGGAAYGVSGGLATLTVLGGEPVTVLNSAGGWVDAAGYGRDRGWLEPDEGQYDGGLDVFTGPGTALALRAEALREVGLLDERFFLYYEDTDMCWRLRLAGWEVRYAPDAVVRHAHAASSGARSALHAFHDQRNRLLTLVKNAPAGLAAREVARHPLTTASLRLRGGAPGWLVRARLRAFGSFLRLLPHALAQRRRIGAAARVGRGEVAVRWLGNQAVHRGG